LHFRSAGKWIRSSISKTEQHWIIISSKRSARLLRELLLWSRLRFRSAEKWFSWLLCQCRLVAQKSGEIDSKIGRTHAHTHTSALISQMPEAKLHAATCIDIDSSTFLGYKLPMKVKKSMPMCLCQNQTARSHMHWHRFLYFSGPQVAQKSREIYADACGCSWALA